jgi:hypothetical protein
MHLNIYYCVINDSYRHETKSRHIYKLWPVCKYGVTFDIFMFLMMVGIYTEMRRTW